MQWRIKASGPGYLAKDQHRRQLLLEPCRSSPIHRNTSLAWKKVSILKGMQRRAVMASKRARGAMFFFSDQQGHFASMDQSLLTPRGNMRGAMMAAERPPQWPAASETVFLSDLRAREGQRRARKAAERPPQWSAAAETAFLSEFQNQNLDRSFRQPRGPLTIDDAWNRLSLEEREDYAAKAKENEIYNTSNLAEFNERWALSPSVEILQREELRAWLPMWPQPFALQSWKMYRSDHPWACGGPKTPVPETPFRIMDLPIELRREIFSHVLSRSRPVLQFPPEGSADGVQGPVDVRLFAVSRQVFAEAIEVFYEVNTFGISTMPYIYYYDIPLFVRQSTGNEAPKPTDSIRRVHVSFKTETYYYHALHIEGFLFLWKRFCDFLRTCRSLQKIQVTVKGGLERYMATDLAICPLYNKLVKILITIRSTDEAVFSDVSTVTVVGESSQVPAFYRVRQITGTMI